MIGQPLRDGLLAYHLQCVGREAVAQWIVIDTQWFWPLQVTVISRKLIYISMRLPQLFTYNKTIVFCIKQKVYVEICQK